MRQNLLSRSRLLIAWVEGESALLCFFVVGLDLSTCTHPFLDVEKRGNGNRKGGWNMHVGTARMCGSGEESVARQTVRHGRGEKGCSARARTGVDGAARLGLYHRAWPAAPIPPWAT